MNLKKRLIELSTDMYVGKLCHETTFFGHAILSTQLCLHSFCLFVGMHNILKYMHIY